MTAVAVLAALAGSPGLAQAEQVRESGLLSATDDNPLPPGWRIGGEGGSPELVRRAPKAVPMGDARVEFRTGGAPDRLLGVPKPAKDGRTFRLTLDQTRAKQLRGLQVTAAGRRLDAAADAPHESGSRGAVRDQVAEPAESTRLALTDRNAEPLPGRPVLTGTVLDKP